MGALSDSKIPSLTSYARLLLLYHVRESQGKADERSSREFIGILLEKKVPFVLPERQSVEGALNDLRSRGLVEWSEDATYKLTSDGQRLLSDNGPALERTVRTLTGENVVLA